MSSVRSHKKSLNPISRTKKAKDALSSPWASGAAVLISILWTVPTFGLLVSSIRSQKDINTSGWWNFFTHPAVTFQNYQTVLFKGSPSTPPLSQYFMNSLVIAIPASLFPLIIGLFAAYALAWFDFKGRDTLFLVIFALQIVPLQMSLIPLLKMFSGWGITGTFLPIWLAHTMFGMPIAIFLMHNAVSQVPRELVEAAKMDGADTFMIFRKLVFPLSIPAMASLLIFQFLWVWNDLLVGLTFGGGKKTVAPLTVRLAEMTGTRGGDWEILTAGAFVSITVPLIVFFSLQRYFVRGMLSGSVKG